MKRPHRRRFLHLAASAAALPAVSHIARAQAYPSRPVTIIVGFPVGGGIDLDARLMAQWLSDRLGQPFNVENRIGSGSAVATEAVVRAPADGYTLLFATAANALGPALYPNLKYDFIRALTLASMSPALISRLSVSTISAGAPRGATIPTHELAS